jgi:hypothetical protein
MFRDWLLQYSKISSSELAKSDCLCPECGARAIDFQYVGDVATRVGYFAMWCNSCLRGIHISRARAPENESMLSFKDPIELITSRIPNYQHVVPKN